MRKKPTSASDRTPSRAVSWIPGTRMPEWVLRESMATFQKAKQPAPASIRRRPLQANDHEIRPLPLRRFQTQPILLHRALQRKQHIARIHQCQILCRTPHRPRYYWAGWRRQPPRGVPMKPLRTFDRLACKSQLRPWMFSLVTGFALE